MEKRLMKKALSVEMLKDVELRERVDQCWTSVPALIYVFISLKSKSWPAWLSLLCQLLWQCFRSVAAWWRVAEQLEEFQHQNNDKTQENEWFLFIRGNYGEIKMGLLRRE